MDWWLIGGLVAAAVLVALLRYFVPVPRIVREHERGLRFRKGHLAGELGPGRYWLRPRVEELTVIDVRRRQSVVSGQEVLTSDRVPLKVSLIAEFTVRHVIKAVGTVERYEEALYGRIQLALREAVATRELDVALAERGELGQAILELVRDGAMEFGVELHSVQVRDFMMAGGLRGAYTEVVQAKQRGLAALEKARGESAAVRSLANAAQLMERHPGIMQLRLLQAVESGSGNRVVIALDPERGKGTELDVSAEGDN
ncbi:MAG: slipin family protein [Gemmatimonadetes bacterium]|nr:slipin family protein [Gemmatimonadota bacterium]